MEQGKMTGGGFYLVAEVSRFEVAADLVVKIGDVGGGKQCPFAVFHDAFHEQVGDPVCRVHVVGAAAFVAGIFAQVEEFLDVEVPGFQIGADRAFEFSALVAGDRGGVDGRAEGRRGGKEGVRQCRSRGSPV